jgi:hypothetical protein
MNQQKQTMLHNEPIKTKKKQTLAPIAHWTMHKHIFIYDWKLKSYLKSKKFEV